jgi:hypothetical protein
LQALDIGGTVAVDSSANRTVQVPSATTIPLSSWPVGQTCRVLRLGTGTVQITAAGGVTVSTAEAGLVLNGRWAEARLTRLAANSWLASGRLTS